MHSEAQRDQVARRLMAMWITVAAMCTAVLLLAGVVVLLIDRRVAEEPLLAFVALVGAVACIIAAARQHWKHRCGILRMISGQRVFA